MKWQEKCAEIFSLLESFFPEVKYQIVLRKEKEEWRCVIEQVRNDKGPHTGTAFGWLDVKGEDVEQLPDKLLEKVKARILEWQQDGLAKIKKQAEELQRARDDFDKRMSASLDLDRLEKKLAT